MELVEKEVRNSTIEIAPLQYHSNDGSGHISICSSITIDFKPRTGINVSCFFAINGDNYLYNGGVQCGVLYNKKVYILTGSADDMVKIIGSGIEQLEEDPTTNLLEFVKLMIL